MELSKLHESLFILFKCRGSIKRLYEAINKHRERGPLYSLHHFTHDLAFYLIMETNSFLIEYDKFFTEGMVEPEYKERVRIVRQVLKPLIKKIKAWKEIPYLRNTVIAHGLRDKTKGSRLVIPYAKDYDVPKSAFEFQLLNDLITFAFNVIEEDFGKEIDDVVFYCYGGQNIKKLEKDYSNINIELEAIITEMNQISQSLGKSYKTTISGYTFHGDKQKDIPSQ